VSEKRSDAPEVRQDFDAESELLPKDPPPVALRLTTDVVLGFFLVAAVFIALVKLPATVTGRFVLRPAGGVDPVSAPWDGVVEEVRVSLGSVVEKDAVLFVLRAEDLRRLAAERAELREQLRGHRERLAALRGEAPAGVAPAEFRARVSRLESELELNRELAAEQQLSFRVRIEAAQSESRRRSREAGQRRARTKTLEELLDTMVAARDEGVASSRDVLVQRASLESARADLEDALRERETAQSTILALESEREVELRQHALVLTRTGGELDEARGALRDKDVELAALVSSGEERLASLDHALVPVVGDRLEVRAPWAGSVVALGVERSGSVVARGALLCELTRSGAPLVARATLPETAAARVSEGQAVRLLLDGYPHARHGVKKGRLSWVSPMAQAGELTAIAELEDNFVRVEGADVPLRAGLEGEIRVRTGSRSLLEYVLEPLRQVRENIAPEAGDDG